MDVQHVDAISWWIAGTQPEKTPHWLWVFADSSQTLYRIDDRRTCEVAEEMLGADFRGVWALLKGAMSLKATGLPARRAEKHGAALEANADRLLRPRDDLTDPEESVRIRLWERWIICLCFWITRR